MAGKGALRRNTRRRKADKKKKATLKGGQSNGAAETDVLTPSITEVTVAVYRQAWEGRY